MALDARSRHHLYLQLEEALGPEAASTLMEHLPPVGWADVATKRDLDALEERINLRFEASEARIDARFAAVDARFAAVDARFDVIDARFDAIDARFEAFDTQFEATENKLLAAFRGELQAALTAQGRQLAISLAGTAATLSALAFAAARLT